MSTKRRRLNRAAKEGLLGLQRLKDGLRALVPLVPIDREPEVDALLELLEEMINLILDDEEPGTEARLQAGLRCVHLFPHSLEVSPDQEDDD